MDVGCNKGLLCVELTARFKPTSILGIDSDPLLIDKIMMWTTMLSYRSLRLSESLSKTNEPRPRLRTSEEASPLVEGQAFPGIVCFVRKGIVDLSSSTPSESRDVVVLIP